MKMNPAYVLPALLLAADTSAQAGGGAVGDQKIRVLIVDGFGNHDWEATTRAISSILGRDNAFEVEVSTVPDKQDASWRRWNPGFAGYDAVIQNTNDISRQGAWPEPAKRSLERYVSGGGGLLIFHSANNAFPDWPEYNQMIGLGWRKRDFGPAVVVEDGGPVRVPAGQGGNTSHGKRVDVLITRLGDHPIHQGLPRQWMAADLEVYRYARGPAENLAVLSYAKEAETGLNFPIEWVVAYGQGRVYASTFGHYWHTQAQAPPGIRCRGFRALLPRAVRWLADAEIPGDTPEGFPAQDRVSLDPS